MYLTTEHRNRWNKDGRFSLRGPWLIRNGTDTKINQYRVVYLCKPWQRCGQRLWLSALQTQRRVPLASWWSLMMLTGMGDIDARSWKTGIRTPFVGLFGSNFKQIQ